MLSVKELRSYGRSLSAESFRRQLGPFALVQKPDFDAGSGTVKMGVPSGAQTTRVVRGADMASAAITMLLQFEDLVVATLPPLTGNDELSVGRQPDCELVLEHASVSKRHAVIRWNEAQERCTVQDLGSTNGTWINGGSPIRSEVEIRDGDIVCFGEQQFWFLSTATLHSRLRAVERGRT